MTVEGGRKSRPNRVDHESHAITSLAPVVDFWIRVSQVLLALGASTLPLEPIGDPIVRLNPFL